MGTIFTIGYGGRKFNIMRVLLINPHLLIKARYKLDYWPFLPLGLAYIAGILAKHHEVRAIDAFAQGWNTRVESGGIVKIGLSDEALLREVGSKPFDFVGITCMFSAQIEAALSIARLIKKVSKSTQVIVGGPGVSVEPVKPLEDKDVDFVAIGEGEYTLAELLQQIEEGGGGFDSIKGIGYRRRNGEIIINPRRELVKKLDELPLPARHLFPMEKYFKYSGRRQTLMITSRGCPFKCIFCSIHGTMGRTFRARSPANVLTEIGNLKREFDIEEILFEDDNLTLDQERAERIFDLLIERNMNIEWKVRNGVRADTLTPRILQKMKQSGCPKIMIAPESGNQDIVNKLIKKGLDLKRVEQVVSDCYKIGLDVGCFFVIGLPGETKTNINETIAYARKLRGMGASSFWFSIATPYFGTELYRIAEEKGYLKNDFNEKALWVHEASISTEEFTAKEILELRAKAMSELNPIFTWRNLLKALKNPWLAAKYLQHLCQVAVLGRFLEITKKGS